MPARRSGITPTKKDSPPKRVCVKCRGEEIDLRYIHQGRNEWLRVKCLTCGFSWNEVTADKKRT